MQQGFSSFSASKCIRWTSRIVLMILLMICFQPVRAEALIKSRLTQSVSLRGQSGGYIPGDINGDQKTNIFDVIRLLKYVTGENVQIVPGSADTNGDNKTNIFDVIRLLKYVTGENVMIYYDAPIIVRDGEGSEDMVFRRNEMATVTVSAKPNTVYSIEVYYNSGKSTAKGLEPKNSDAAGQVAWTWKIGGSTAPGTYRIVIQGGGERIERAFTVITQ